MPIYEYKCDACGDVFEVMQKFSDQPLTTHEACGGAVHRLLSAPAFQLKGTGWYATDYAKKNNSGARSPSSESSNGSGKKTETKTETPAKTEASSTPSGSPAEK